MCIVLLEIYSDANQQHVRVSTITTVVKLPVNSSKKLINNVSRKRLRVVELGVVKTMQNYDKCTYYFQLVVYGMVPNFIIL